MSPIELAAISIIVVLAGVILHQTWTFHVERRGWKEQQADLFNRLMARDFTEYAQGARVVGPVHTANLDEYISRLREKGAAAEDGEPAEETPSDGRGISVL